jgi:hypothetical protein
MLARINKKLRLINLLSSEAQSAFERQVRQLLLAFLLVSCSGWGLDNACYAFSWAASNEREGNNVARTRLVPLSRKDKQMIDGKIQRSIARKISHSGLLVALLMAATTPAISADGRKAEVIDATAMGTSTQMGKTVSVKVTIYRYSSQADRQILVDAFKKNQSQGLVDALSKMDAVGRIAITGTLGYDLSYIALIPSPTGRKIRFAANRQIRFAEAYNSGRSTDYDLTAGEFDLNDSDKNKSSGVLYPAAQLNINKKSQLQFELFRNPWKLVNIIDWNGAGSKE